MKELGFMDDDIKTVTSLMKCHIYRDMSQGSCKAILSAVGEKNIDLFFAMKECENINKNQALKETFDKQLQQLKDGINKEIKNNNRELISILPLKAKHMMGLGLKGKQIGQMQNLLAEHIRNTPKIYAYYKARGHVDKYKKDLSILAQEKAKEIKKGKNKETHQQQKENQIKEEEKIMTPEKENEFKQNISKLASEKVLSQEEINFL